MADNRTDDQKVISSLHRLDVSLKGARAAFADLNRQMLRANKLQLPRSQTAARVHVHLIPPDGFVFGLAGLDFPKDVDRCDSCGQPGGGMLMHHRNEMDPDSPLVICVSCAREEYYNAA